jgi:hypothetical protein
MISSFSQIVLQFLKFFVCWLLGVTTMVNPLKEMELLRRVKKEEEEEEQEEEDEKEEQETIASASKKAESSESSSVVASGVPQDGSLGRPFEKQKMQESFERHHHHVTGAGGVEVEENSEDTLPTVSGFMDSGGGGEGMDQDQSPLLGKHHNGRSEEIQQESTSSKAAAAAASSSETVEVAAQTVKEMEVKYAAYMRHDIYGNWGMNSVPVLEKVKLLLALLTLCPIRFCLLLFFLVVFYLICKVCTLRVVASSNDEGQESFAHMTGARRAIVVRSGRFLARVMLFVFGFYNIHVDHRTPDRQLLHLGAAASSHERKDDEEEEEEEQFGAIVSNHVSYLDILYHMSASFPSFVAKRSVGKLPLVGLISKCLGCVYVQRESKSSDFKGVSGKILQYSCSCWRVWLDDLSL